MLQLCEQINYDWKDLIFGSTNKSLVYSIIASR